MKGAHTIPLQLHKTIFTVKRVYSAYITKLVTKETETKFGDPEESLSRSKLLGSKKCATFSAGRQVDFEPVCLVLSLNLHSYNLFHYSG